LSQSTCSSSSNSPPSQPLADASTGDASGGTGDGGDASTLTDGPVPLGDGAKDALAGWACCG
jgi:hypothetical protein